MDTGAEFNGVDGRSCRARIYRAIDPAETIRRDESAPYVGARTPEGAMNPRPTAIALGTAVGRCFSAPNNGRITPEGALNPRPTAIALGTK